MRLMPLRLMLVALAIGASSLRAPMAHAATVALADTCTDCIAVADTCCEKAPNIQDPAGTPMSNHVLVATREAAPYYPFCVTIFDLSSPLPSGPEDTDWTAMTRYNGPGGSWNADSLGTVFGLTLDDKGNIYVCHTSCYGADLLGQVFGGGAGAVYRIDGTTGAINTFVKLPNFPDGSITPPENMPGLGNISFDCRHQQFFVTDMEDGRIYRIKPSGNVGVVVQTFDPMGPDNGLPGFAPLGERLWAVQVHGDRVYYSVWAEDQLNQSATAMNSIRSVGLDAVGAIVPTSDKHEMYLPPMVNCLYCTTSYSNPVSDISFAADGRMLLGERDMYGATSTGAHDSRVLEYQCVNFCWQRTNVFAVGDYGYKQNSAGGVDYDRYPYVAGGAIGRVWATGDAIHFGSPYTDYIYGLQGFRPTGGSNLNSMLIDFDGFTASTDKTYLGDVEAPGCPAVLTSSVCGTKYMDLNHNGVHDAGEPGLAGWTIVLTGPGGTFTVTTDAAGNYCFNDVSPGTYTVTEVNQVAWVQTAPAGGVWNINVVQGASNTGIDFGNYPCNNQASCVNIPTGMGAWWPFNETAGSTTLSDVTHLSPPRNVAQTFGSSATTINGEVGNRLCFTQDLDYAKVLNANQVGINFAAGSFAVDAWLKLLPGVGGTRVIAEKRLLLSGSPYKTRGWAVYLNGSQLFLEIGNGVTTQVVPGPSVPASVWTHFAVSVDRTTASGTWYLNGAVQSAYTFAPITGSLYCNADLWMGKGSPSFASSVFGGCIDELELFTTALSATNVANLYSAGAAGKCPEYLSMPSTFSICKNQNSVNVCFTICNTTATAQSYHWSIAPWPAGPGCSVAGPTSFSPNSGSVTVPAGGCSGPICVTIPRPAGLTAQNLTSCFGITWMNDATGVCHISKGTIRADYSCYCIGANQTGVVTVPARLAAGIVGVPIDIGVGHPCDPVARLSYQLSAVFTDPNQDDPLEVSLNGLPPGEPVIGTLDLAPGQDGTITVAVAYPKGYDPAGRYEIVLDADTDGDGTMERVCGTDVQVSYDSTETTAVPSGPRPMDSLRLAASPNPFSGGSTIGFTLAAPDHVELGVYDVNGRLVRALERGPLQAGIHAVTWDGLDSQGRHAPAGVYFVRLRSQRLDLDTKVVKMR